MSVSILPKKESLMKWSALPLIVVLASIVSLCDTTVGQDFESVDNLDGKPIVMSRDNVTDEVRDNLRFASILNRDWVVIPTKSESTGTSYDRWIPFEKVSELKVFASRAEAEKYVASRNAARQKRIDENEARRQPLMQQLSGQQLQRENTRSATPESREPKLPNVNKPKPEDSEGGNIREQPGPSASTTYDARRNKYLEMRAQQESTGSDSNDERLQRYRAMRASQSGTTAENDKASPPAGSGEVAAKSSNAAVEPRDEPITVTGKISEVVSVAGSAFNFVVGDKRFMSDDLSLTSSVVLAAFVNDLEVTVKGYIAPPVRYENFGGNRIGVTFPHQAITVIIKK